MNRSFVIAENTIDPGQNVRIKLPVSRLPSGNQIAIQSHIYRSALPGPTILLLAGMHGDEINGIEIVRRIIQMRLLEDLERGSVIAIPLLNVYGFINFSRDAANGKDVNRSFPGSSSGSMASRVARILTKYFMHYVDFGLDFHTGGQSRFNYPQVRFNPKDPRSEALAQVFNAPMSLAKPTIPKSFRRTCLTLNIPAIVYEGGESLRLDEFSINEGIRGVKRILNNLEMKHFPVIDQHNAVINKSIWARARTAGVFSASRLSGDYISKGDILGSIKDPYGFGETIIQSTYNGMIICHNNHPVVYPGDALFNIGIL